MVAPLEFLVDHSNPEAKLSIILLDWGARESFHSLRYLNEQTVDRSRYELIWIEFFDHQPAALLDAVRSSEEAGQPLLDKLVVMNHPRDFLFHKHRMYNLGIVLSEGEICVICDSDAMFAPTFIERVLEAFESEPHPVLHVDEVRSISRDFYPFNYPTFEKLLVSECPNWTGRTTFGLANSKDMLHEANYGACFAARRDDIIRIGGADEHLDYLGYICGPYELTFRLVNAGCRERWLHDEFLYHTWHPGESGINIDYQGPSDGLGISSRALEARESGRIEPGVENGAIRALRNNPQLDRRTALSALQSGSDAEWRRSARMDAENAKPQLVAKAFHGSYDVYFYQNCWYGIPTCDEAFDPLKAKAGRYSLCLRHQSRRELERWIRWVDWIAMIPPFLRSCYRKLRRWSRALRGGRNAFIDRKVQSTRPVREGHRGRIIASLGSESSGTGSAQADGRLGTHSRCASTTEVTPSHPNRDWYETTARGERKP
jgi:hypothetical protein